jgi:beta-carotene 3-hydroxylase
MTLLRKYALHILIIFHIVGLFGLSGENALQFALLTPMNLLLSAFLLGLHHGSFSLRFLLVALTVYIAGVAVECFGTNTGLLFGEYRYGAALGFKLWNTPLMIGVNWLLLVYCVSVMVQRLNLAFTAKTALGAALMTGLDFIIEPIAMRYDFWQWKNDVVPLQNYIAWFLVALPLVALMLKSGKPPRNKMAPALFVTQTAFFSLLHLIPLLQNNMSTTLNIFAVIATFFFMEFVAWFTHKYIMHGLLWVLHKDHHQKEPGFFEKNDSFFLIFAIPSALLIMFGMMNGNDVRLYIGIGIALYGLAYFLVHDIFIHQRFKIFRRTNQTYMRAIRKAHKVHHKHLNKEHGECFGMLIVPYRYFMEAKRAKDSGVLPE